LAEPDYAAIVNGEAITPDMVEAEIKISRLNIVEPMPPLTGEDLDRATEEAVNQLITRHLILQAAARQNFTLDEAFVNSRVDLLFGAYGNEALDEALKQAGATRGELFWWVKEIFTVEEFTTQVVMADAPPEQRQQVYNDWLDAQRATANIKTYLNGEAQTPPALIGQPAPDFTLTTPDGQPVSLSDYAGQVVLVNFWATWCPSCITEMPEYEQVYQYYGQGDFVVLAVNLQEGQEQVAQYANGLGLTFPVLLDRDGNVTTRQYQVIGMPASFIIDREGKIFYRHFGPMSGETLQAKLAELGL
jgi:peroxiredoxin